MKDLKKQTITPEQYCDLLDAISDAGVAFIRRSVETMMPEHCVNSDTLQRAALHVATKVICMLYPDDEKARRRHADSFGESLSTLVEDAIIITAASMNKNKH